MRGDALGLFWEDMPKPKGAGSRGPRQRGAMPPIPDTGWTPPEFPNLSAAKVIGFDTETWDPELNDAGPGWGRGKGHIIGASLSVADGTSWYFPIRHGIENGKQVLPPEQAAMNMDPDQVLRFLDSVLWSNVPKVGANVLYDVGWLNWEGVRVAGSLYDVQFAEALLNSEAPDVSLDNLGERYLNVGKQTSILYDWLARWCGGKASDRQRANLYLSPPTLAGPYAQDDASLPIAILSKQWPAMQRRGVLELFDLECRLIPLLVKMRAKGAPVDVERAEKVYEDFGGRLKHLEAKLTHVAGQPVNPNAAESIKSAFMSMGIPLPTKIHKKTRKEVVSFDKPRLEAVDNELTRTVLEYRALAKVRDVFIGSYLLDKHVNGRVYCSFHPLRGDGTGARSGRFSSSDPNLQNIPIRTEEGKLVREAFATKHGRWRSLDYSSIEYRLLAHYAVGEKSDEVRALLNADPTLDYHEIVGELVLRMTGIDLPRSNVKNINFGLIYGMQLAALAAMLKLSRSEAKALIDDYHRAVPYARSTMDEAAREVHTTGMVRTILNRASDFNAWGPKGYQPEGRPAPVGYEAAASKWGMYNIERQMTHKALNRRLQGSAADVMKKAMVTAYEAGLFADDACGIPILTVHDELDFEDLGPLENPAWDELKRTMETCMGDLLRVPLLVSSDMGTSWAEAH